MDETDGSQGNVQPRPSLEEAGGYADLWSHLFGASSGSRARRGARPRAVSEEARTKSAADRAQRLKATWSWEATLSVRRIQLLDWLYRHQHERHIPVVAISGFLDTDARGDHGKSIVRDALRSLRDDFLINLVEGAELADSSAGLTEQGQADVQDRRSRRHDRTLRNAAARDAFVKWLYREGNYAHVSDIHQDMTVTPFGYYEGQPFTERDLEAARQYLAHAGLVTDLSQSRSLAPEPRLTNIGIDCVEHYGGSVDEYRRRTEGGSRQHTVTFNGPVSGNVGWDSDIITQTATTTGTPASELAAVVRAITEALPVLGLPADDASQVAREIQIVEAQLVDGLPDGAVVRTLMQRVLATLGNAADSSLALILGAYAKELMKKVGIPVE